MGQNSDSDYRTHITLKDFFFFQFALPQVPNAILYQTFFTVCSATEFLERDSKMLAGK